MKKILVSINKKAILIIISLASLYACNDELNFDIPQPDDKIVIDGWIEKGEIANVLLTRNSPFFTSIDSASFRELVLTRAKVTISNGEITENMILRKDEKYFPPFIYQSNKVKGKEGGVYYIHAEFGGKEAYAVTTIPKSVEPDTVYFEPVRKGDSLGLLKFEFTDPPDRKNYYRFFTKVQGKDRKFISSLIVALEDSYFSGRKAEFSLYRSSKSPILRGENKYFQAGDTVVFKLSTMDKESYEFWSSYQDEVLNVNNPFASSVMGLESNIEGDGLGVWSGYASSFYAIIIKKPDEKKSSGFN